MTVRVLVGSALSVLRTLPAESVQLCVTSPPYFGLRAYGTDPQVWGGDPEHGHTFPEMPIARPKKHRDTDERREYLTAPPASWTNRESTWDSGAGAFCPCGAWRGELGSEPTPGLFIEHLLLIFDEVKRVLRTDGLCFVNLGDSYSGSGKGPTTATSTLGVRGGKGSLPTDKHVMRTAQLRQGFHSQVTPWAGIPAKNLLLIPQRFAIAMQDRGWIVRSEIVWAKTSAMPESTRDRPTSAWEPIWMFAKSRIYFYDSEAVRTDTRYDGPPKPGVYASLMQDGGKATMNLGVGNPAGANLRNVWTLGPSPFADAHFATFPPEVPRRCVLAGTSERGCCGACGAPWVRSTEVSYTPHGPSAKAQVKTTFGERTGGDVERGSIRPQELPYGRASKNVTTTGWQPSCSCPPADPVPQVVLDPFLGSGTTAMVADRLGRDAIGIELSESYAEMARKRIEQDAGSLFGEPVAVEIPEQLALFVGAAG